MYLSEINSFVFSTGLIWLQTGFGSSFCCQVNENSCYVEEDKFLKYEMDHRFLSKNSVAWTSYCLILVTCMILVMHLSYSLRHFVTSELWR